MKNVDSTDTNKEQVNLYFFSEDGQIISIMIICFIKNVNHIDLCNTYTFITKYDDLMSLMKKQI